MVLSYLKGFDINKEAFLSISMLLFIGIFAILIYFWVRFITIIIATTTTTPPHNPPPVT